MRASKSFSQPKQALTKDFIRTATHIDQALETILGHQTLANLADDEWLVELSYVGEQTGQPIIAEMFSTYQVVTNILYGNVETIQEVPLGSLIVTLKGTFDNRQRALDYLNSQGVSVTILKRNNKGGQ